MTALELIAAPLIIAGVGFFLVGSLGVLRLPDLHSRLHAVTKADNLGLGLIASGLALQADGLAEAAKYLAIWLAILPASAVAGHLIARLALRDARTAEAHKPTRTPS
ncbi:MAG: monovalent cation/H(+) antiporter subunit G [Chromatiales bacterium]|nr:monovalent cation/H(+) antiporter subunit G [Gammaproteobacteria bacterium]MCP5352655.1 monovalent cation/H(+) antiporter subunit G [Chromatiales bacterium]